MNTVRQWLEANKSVITHFRPRRWCGVEMLLPYNRNAAMPLMDGPTITDDAENAALIREVLGDGFIEEPFQAQAGSRNY